MCDMQRIDLFKMEKLFQTFQGLPVTVYFTGTITIPIYIKSFDWQHSNNEIAFGDEDDIDNWTRLGKDEDLKAIMYEYDNFCHEDKIRFVCQIDIFTTLVDVVFDCSLRAGDSNLK